MGKNLQIQKYILQYLSYYIATRQTFLLTIGIHLENQYKRMTTCIS